MTEEQLRWRPIFLVTCPPEGEVTSQVIQLGMKMEANVIAVARGLGVSQVWSYRGRCQHTSCEGRKSCDVNRSPRHLDDLALLVDTTSCTLQLSLSR